MTRGARELSHGGGRIRRQLLYLSHAPSHYW